jgi:hypothetical protein
LTNLRLISEGFYQRKSAIPKLSRYIGTTDPFGSRAEYRMSVVPIDVACFWAKAKVLGADDCWEWQGAVRGKGYGVFRKISAHRYAYQTHRGPIPDGLLIRHMCGNKLCVNPSHLEPGTAQDNMDDRRRLGEKMPYGTNGNPGALNGRAKLSEEEARYIIANPDGLTGNQLAMKFNVSKATISLIRSGRRWGHAA